MSRVTARTGFTDAAEGEALRSMLRTWSSPAAVRDGRDLVLEALDDPGTRKSIAQHLASEVREMTEDDAPLAKLVRERVLAYARSCPCFEDEVSKALADRSAA